VIIFGALLCQIVAVFFLKQTHEKGRLLSLGTLLFLAITIGSFSLYSQFYGVLAGIIIAIACHILVGTSFVLIRGLLFSRKGI
jgi:predicted branched-subunit amino acid permease